jgi:signal transduction histidine kinase
MSGSTLPGWTAATHNLGMQREQAASIETRRLLSRDLINRVLVFGALAGFIAAVYAGIVFGLAAVFDAHTPNTGLAVLATSAVALTFARVRRHAQRVANRITYGERAMPDEVLARFSEEVAASYAPEEALPRMARAVAEGTGASRSEVWVRIDDALLFAADWPTTVRRRRPRVTLGGSSLPSFSGADRVVAVRHHDDLLGAITIAKRPGEPVTDSEDKLLADVASQAGLVLRNVRLTADLAARLEEIEGTAAELRASRQRIVETQDAERRRIERDIHDGAQQHLVALAVKLRMARTYAERDPARAGPALTDVRELIEGALDNLRALSRGIYPPVLAERGVVAALRAQAKEAAGMKTTVSARGVERLDPAIEAAIYFCCLEAVQNAAKHGAGCATVRLEGAGSELRFTITDDGPGFDPETATRGSGMQNMEDRIAAVGGSFEIRSAPGAGSTVAGSVPAGTRERR